MYALRAIDGLTTAMFAFAGPVMIYNVTKSLQLSGLAFFLEWLPRMIATPLIAPFVDRYGAKRIFLFTNGCRTLLFVVVTITFAATLHWQLLLVAAIIAGMMGQMSFVAAEHVGVMVATPQTMHRVQAHQVNIDQSLLVAGPIIGGLLLYFGNSATLIGAATLAAAAFLLATAAQSYIAKNDSADTRSLSTLQGLKKGIRLICKHQILRLVVMCTMLNNILLGTVMVIVPATVKEAFSGTDTTVSIVWASAAAASIVAVTIGAKLLPRIGLAQLGLISGLATAAGATCIALASSLLAYILAMCLFMAADGLFAVYIRTVRTQTIPAQSFGVAVGAITLLNIAPLALSGALVGLIGPGLVPALLICGSAIATIALCMAYSTIHRTLSPTNDVEDARA